LKILIFILLSLVTIGGAIMVVARKSPVDSVLYLLLTMVSLAGHYVMLKAPFLAAVQIIVYAGAVVVLFLFVIMLLNLRRERILARKLPKGRWRYALAGVAVMLVLTGLFRAGAGWIESSADPAALAGPGTVEILGLDLFQRWVYPFELTSVLLLAAMVGAVVLTRRTGTLRAETAGAPEVADALDEAPARTGGSAGKQGAAGGIPPAAENSSEEN